MRTIGTRLSVMLDGLRRLGHAATDWCSFQMGTVSIRLNPPPETPVDRAIREEGERLRNAFPGIDFEFVEATPC